MLDMYTLKQGHNLNKLGRAPQGEVIYEKQGSICLVGPDKKFSFYL